MTDRRRGLSSITGKKSGVSQTRASRPEGRGGAGEREGGRRTSRKGNDRVQEGLG